MAKTFLDENGAHYLVQKVKDIISNYITKDEIQSITDAEIESIFMRYFPLKADTVEDLKKYFDTTGNYINVKLNDNFTLDTPLTVPGGKKAVIDLNGKTLTIPNNNIISINGGEMTISGEGTITGNQYLAQVQGDGVLNVEGGNLISTNDCAISAINGGTVNVSDGYIQAQEVGVLAQYEGSTINVNGGTIKGIDNFAIGGNGTAGRGGTIINVTGGTLEGNIVSNGYVACAIYHPQDGELNITGGEIISHGGCGVLMRAGQLNMTGGSITATGEADLLGKVGDSNVTVGPHGVIYDQKAHYPDNANLGVYIGGDAMIVSEHGKSIDILKDDDHIANVIVDGGTLIPSYVA